MSLVRALIAARLCPTADAIVDASRRIPYGTARPGSARPYMETDRRRRMRALLDGAGLAGAQVKLGFLKNSDGQLRYMLCEPCPGTDTTAQYVTVVDVELSEQAERTVYRRVNLDTIVAAEVSFKA